MEKTNYLQDFKASLEKLEMHELRTKASKMFGLRLTREHKKEEIVDLIMAEMSKSNYAEEAEGELRPGYSRIILNRTEGKSTLVYINCNGYYCWIPVDHPVDVPTKVISILENAKEMKKIQNEFHEYVDILTLSYPYQVIATCPGPDPKPGREAQTEKKWAPFRAFYEKYGRWPSQKVLDAYTASSVRFNSFDHTPEEE